MEPQIHHSAFSFYTYVTVVICGIGLMIYAVPQQSKARGSYLVRSDGNIMLFRKPLPMRRATLAAAIFLALLVISLLVSAPYMRNPAPAYLPGVVSLGLPVFFLYLSGPDDIWLDGTRRTYERTVGWPWKPTTHLGSFDGIKGVCISPRNNVLLLLEKPESTLRNVVLRSSGTEAEAEALVENLKREFGFSIVPYPKK